MKDPYEEIARDVEPAAAAVTPDPYAGIARDVEPVATAVAPDPYAGIAKDVEPVTASTIPDPYAGIAKDVEPVAPVAAPDPYAGIAKDVESMATAVAPDPYAGIARDVEPRPPVAASEPVLKSPGIVGNVARSATSAGGMLAEKGAQIVQGLEDTAQGIFGLPRAIRDKAFTYLWQAFPDQMQKFQESRSPSAPKALEESKPAQIKAQGETVVNDFMDAVRETHQKALNEIHKQGGIPAYVAQQIAEGAGSLAIDLALLHKVSGAQPAELTGTRDLIREAAVQNAKASAAIYATTPGTPEEKTKAALHSVAIMGVPTAASVLPANWMAKTAAILANAGLNSEAYMNGIQEARRQAETQGNPADWPKYAVSTLGVQAMTDFMFGILTRAQRGDPAAREVLADPEMIRLQEEVGRQTGDVSANPEAAALAVKRQSEFVPLTEIKPSPVVFSTPNTLHLVQRKTQLNKAGQTPENVERYVDQYYKEEAYAPILEGKDNVYLVMPSTSRENKIPDVLADRLQADFGGKVILADDFARPNALDPAKERAGYIRKMQDPSTFQITDPELATKLAGKNVVIVDDIYTSGESADGMREILAAQGIPVHQVATLTALQQGQQVGRPTLEALAVRISRITGESPKQILSDLVLAHGHSSVKLLKNLEKELRVQDGGKNARQIRDLIRAKAETLRTTLGGGATAPSGIRPGEQTGPIPAAGVREGQEPVSGISPMEQSRTVPASGTRSRGIFTSETGRPEEARGIDQQNLPQRIKPRNKAELDLLYPGRIQLFEHPALRYGSGPTGGITYLHKDMTPKMRADWLARPESRGDRATQAAGLDAFMQEGQAPQTSDGATEATVSRPTLPRQIDNAALPKLEAGKPVSQADIRRNLSQALDIPVRLGIRAPGATSGALGIFRAKAETIRMKLLNDLPVLSHEVGHYLHYILLGDLPVRSGQPFERFAGRYDRELIPLGRATSKPSYPEAKIRREGVAEFTRLYLTDSAKSIAVAPEFSAYWKATLEGKYPEINDILKDAQKQIGDYIRQPALVKIKSMIVSSDQAKPRRSVREVVNNLYDDWINQLGPIERTMDWLVKMGLPTEQARLVKGLANNFIGGWRGKTEYALHQASVDLDMKDVGPSLKEILGKVPQLDDFRAYLIAKRAVELNERNKMTGIETADARKVIADLESRYEPIRWELRKFQAQQLKLLVDSGILGKDEAFAMEMMNSMYVPFYRLYEGIGGAGGPRTAGGSGFVNVSQGVRRFKGSDREIIDPLESIVRNAYVFRELAERNKIGSAFVKAVEQVQGGGRVGESVTKPIKAVPINTDEIARIVSQSGLAEEIAKQWGVPVDSKWVSDYLADKKVVAKVWRAMDGMKPKDGIFRIWQNGEEKDFQIGDPELMRALTLADAADATTLNKIPLARWMRYATALKRAGSTLTFEFMGRNPFRDQLTATIYSKFGYIPIVDGFRGMLHALKRDDLYWDWVKHGGRYSDFVSADRTNLQEELANVIRDPNVLQQALSWINPVNVLRNMQKLSEVMETASRLGEYSRGLTAGATPMEAANASKEVTLNFARHGVAGATINKVVAFFNAAVQDPARMAREWKARPKEMLLKNILAITLPSLSLWWLNKDDEEITKLPGWRRTMFWNINLARIPGGPKLIMSFPKPFLEGVLFGTSFEAALDLAWKKDKHAVGDWFDAIQSQIPNPLALDLALPTAEVIANYSFFKGQHIVSSGMERLPAAFQTNPSTSLLSTKVGQLIGISPLKLDFWIKGHFAGMGQYGLDLTDLVLTHSLALEIPPAPAKRISDLPLLRGLRHQPYAPSKYVDYFYAGSQKGEERVAALRNPLVGAKAVKSQWFRQNKLATLWYLGEDEGKLRITRIREIQEGMSDTTRAMSLIQQNMKIEPETKRQKLMKLKDQRDTAAKDALNRYIFPGDR